MKSGVIVQVAIPSVGMLVVGPERVRVWSETAVLLPVEPGPFSEGGAVAYAQRRYFSLNRPAEVPVRICPLDVVVPSAGADELAWAWWFVALKLGPRAHGSVSLMLREARLNGSPVQVAELLPQIHPFHDSEFLKHHVGRSGLPFRFNRSEGGRAVRFELFAQGDGYEVEQVAVTLSAQGD